VHVHAAYGCMSTQPLNEEMARGVAVLPRLGLGDPSMRLCPGAEDVCQLALEGSIALLPSMRSAMAAVLANLLVAATDMSQA